LRDFNAEVRGLVGVDDIGRQIDGENVITGEHYWVPWENLHVIRDGIEASGWQSKADTPAFIEALEGMNFSASLDYPTGDFFIRPADHRAFRDYFIERIEGGRLVVTERFPKELGLYNPPVDLTTLGF
jgi:branched-chain amino acid transport system substrate-binding protein